MRKKKYLGFIVIYLVIAVLFFGCDLLKKANDNEDDDERAHFNVVVALGDSITAGLQPTLNLQSQIINYLKGDKSYASLVAKQMGKTVGTGLGDINEFAYPSFTTFLEDPGVVASFGNAGLQKPFNLLGFPGAIAADFLRSNLTSSPNYPAFNTLFQGILRNVPGLSSDNVLENTNPVQQAAFLGPTFTLLWMGLNDVLGAVASGNVFDPVSVNDFTTAVTAILNYLNTNTNTKFTMANIPNLASIPLVSIANQILAGTTIYGNDTSEGTRALSPTSDFILYNAIPLIQQGMGIASSNPITDQYWLSAAEILSLTAVVNGYNSAIDNLASTYGFPVVDVQALLVDLLDGYVEDGIVFTLQPVTGNAFSIDSIHLTEKAHAVIANRFIDAINSYYNTGIQKLDVSVH